MKFKAITVAASLLLLTGCSASATGGDTSASTEGSGISANYVCQNVGDIVVGYDDYLAYWRDSTNNVPYDELFSYSSEAVSKLQDIADQISAENINWDSGAIVSSFILNIAADIDEISTSTQNRFFPPGRDLNALLQDIALNSDSVLNSACK